MSTPKPIRRVYGSRSIKRTRRTSADTQVLKDAIAAVLPEIAPATVRQTYYQLVSRGVIEKTEQQYKGLVRMLGLMRRAGEIPFSYLADNTRWMRKPRSHDDVDDLLQDTARLYRRNIWRSQDAYVEIWLEKDALSGVLYQVTEEFDVPLMVCRGYPSLTFLNSAAEQIAATGKPTYLYYFGDRDPSGLDIPRKVEAGIREFAPDADVTFQCVAVTEAQIEEYKLPTRPTKKTDTRSKGFAGESVEVDAIAPDVLRALVRRCIEQHIDNAALNTTRKAEASEREWLTRLAANGIGGRSSGGTVTADDDDDPGF